MFIKVNPHRTPTSRRYCKACAKFTVWRYDKELHHSKCEKCGADSRMSAARKPKKIPGVNKKNRKLKSETNIKVRTNGEYGQQDAKPTRTTHKENVPAICGTIVQLCAKDGRLAVQSHSTVPGCAKRTTDVSESKEEPQGLERTVEAEGRPTQPTEENSGDGIVVIFKGKTIKKDGTIE